MMNTLNRRHFVKTAAIGGISLGLADRLNPLYGMGASDGRKVGIIGLDTSHSIAFTKALNTASSDIHGAA